MTDSVSWHYRVVRHHDGNLSLCEVYYGEHGQVTEIVTSPLFAAFTPAGEGKPEIIAALRNALRDAERFDVLDEPKGDHTA